MPFRIEDRGHFPAKQPTAGGRGSTPKGLPQGGAWMPLVRLGGERSRNSSFWLQMRSGPQEWVQDAAGFSAFGSGLAACRGSVVPVRGAGPGRGCGRARSPCAGLQRRARSARHCSRRRVKTQQGSRRARRGRLSHGEHKGDSVRQFHDVRPLPRGWLCHWWRPAQNDHAVPC